VLSFTLLHSKSHPVSSAEFTSEHLCTNSFAPSIIQGLGFTAAKAQLMSVPPFAVAFVVAIISAYISDRFQCRGIVSIVSSLFCVIGFAMFLGKLCLSEFSPVTDLPYLPYRLPQYSRTIWLTLLFDPWNLHSCTHDFFLGFQQCLTSNPACDLHCHCFHSHKFRWNPCYLAHGVPFFAAPLYKSNYHVASVLYPVRGRFRNKLDVSLQPEQGQRG